MTEDELLAKYRETTTEEIIQKKYASDIRREVKLKHPEELDPCAKFPMDEEVYRRMEKDGYYDLQVVYSLLCNPAFLQLKKRCLPTGVPAGQAFSAAPSCALPACCVRR